MTKAEILAHLIDIGVIPIIRTADKQKALRIAEALIDSGLPILEISLSLESSLALVELIAKTHGNNLLIGAGTVLDTNMVQSALMAGACYIVSPVTNANVIAACNKASIVVCPGALTPTEIAYAQTCGADAVKVFPCNAMGGPSYIKSILAPLPHSVLFPCGGVEMHSAAQYIEAGAKSLFVGSSVINMALSEKELYNTTFANAQRLVALVKNSRESLQ